MKLYLRALVTGILTIVGAVAVLAQPVATLQITRTPQGAAVPTDFIGLSVEENIGQSYFGTQSSPNSVFFTLMKNLGTGTLRMGGDSEDSSCWVGQSPPDPALCTYALRTADFQSWVNASAVTGWPILLGVNLAQAESPGAAQYIVNEVSTAFLPVLQSRPGASLLGIETGNEINLYHLEAIRPPSYSLANQAADLESYLTALKANPSTAGIPIAIPAYYNPTASTITSQVDPLVGSVLGCSGCSSHVGLITLHEYPLTIAGGNVPTIGQLLSQASIQNIVQNFTQAVNDMQTKFGLPVQMGETGSVSLDPGQPGVANVQASALWALDYELAMAQIGIRRMNFHLHAGSYYPPISVTSSGTGSFTNAVMPCYYSLYAFGLARGQQFLPVTVTTSANIRAYALSKGASNAVTVYIINKDMTASGQVQITLSSPAHGASYIQLAAPSLSSYVQDVTLGGVQFSDTTGNLTGSFRNTVIQPSNGVYTVTLPNASAVILTINP